MELMKNVIYVFADGACSPNPGFGGWAAIMKFNDHEKEISGAKAFSTNNQMELTAVIQGLTAIKESHHHVPVFVVTDSRYVVDCFNNQWYKKWKSNGWKTTTGDVKNPELWRELIALAETFQHLKWVHVNGHRGHEYNERADKLAVKARQQLAVTEENGSVF